MKKQSLAALAVLAASTGVFGANLVKNGDFETTSNWDPKANYAIVSEDARSGKSCMKITKSYAYQGGIRLEKGKAYKITVSVKCKNVPKGDFNVKILKSEKGKVVGWLNEHGVFQLVQSGGTHDWKEISGIIKPSLIGNGVNGTIFVANEHGKGEVWVDDLSLEQLSDEETAAIAAAATEQVRNGGFEANWGWSTDSKDKKSAFSYDKTTAHNGKGSLKVNSYAYVGGIKLLKGKTYKLSAFIKCKDLPKDGFDAKILKFKKGKVDGYLGKSGVYALIRDAGGTHDWKEASCLIKPDLIGDGVDGVLFLYHTKKGGELWVDDVSLREVIPAAKK